MAEIQSSGDSQNDEASGNAANPRTAEQLRDAMIAKLDKKYHLIYVDYRDELSDEQVEMIASNDYDKLWESFEDWESDARYGGAKYYLDELLADVITDWENEDDVDYSELKEEFDGSDLWDEVRYEIEERDESDPAKELASHSPAVLMRVQVTDEDAAFPMGQEPPPAEEALKLVGLPVTEHNIKVMDSIFAEENPYWSGAVCAWLFNADVDWLYDLTTDENATIEITNPYLLISNPWQGDGWVNEKPFEGTVRIKRGDLRTDKGAWGYGWQDTVGQKFHSGYEVELKVIENEEEKVE